MIIDEKNFLFEYNKEKIFLKSWGTIIKNKIESYIINNGFNKDEFIKIPIKVRVKNDESIFLKAFRRNKPYENPLVDIQDKIALRVVVLYLEEINIIKDFIEKEGIWSFSKDKDFEDSQIEDPFLFGYQSIHYILKNNDEIIVDNIIIPKNTPCELQIRTLLQHAYSEVTHDTLYKPQIASIGENKRLLARSVAMLESADNMFREVNNNMSFKEYDSKIKYLKTKFESITNLKSMNDYRVTNLFIDTYSKELLETSEKKLDEFIDDNFRIFSESIPEKSKGRLLFKTPIIIFLMYMIVYRESTILAKWPLQESLLQELYSELGKSFDV